MADLYARRVPGHGLYIEYGEFNDVVGDEEQAARSLIENVPDVAEEPVSDLVEEVREALDDSSH